MKYVLLSTENRVVEIIPDFDPIFPDVPITERYSKAFLAGLIAVADDVEFAEGWEYDFASGTFSEYVEPELKSTTEDRIVALEAQLAQTDEALIELYEMIGG